MMKFPLVPTQISRGYPSFTNCYPELISDFQTGLSGLTETFFDHISVFFPEIRKKKNES